MKDHREYEEDSESATLEFKKSSYSWRISVLNGTMVICSTHQPTTIHVTCTRYILIDDLKPDDIPKGNAHQLAGGRRGRREGKVMHLEAASE